jgi:uncharacterized GH25 family protein
MTFTKTLLALCLVVIGSLGAARAHDTWVETNTNLVRAGDSIRVDLCLGNHGNEHRDFKLAGKLDLGPATLSLIAPDGKRFDLKDRLIDTGYTPKEGFWTTTTGVAQTGLYTLAHTLDTVVSYAPERAIKSAKTYFVATKSLDKPAVPNGAFDRPLGHALELVPLTNPVLPMGAGTVLRVRLLLHGKPLAGTRIAFIPRGATLTEGIDARYERTTDARGEARLELKEAGAYLVVAHHDAPTESGTWEGKPYQFTKYGATLTVFVPQVCACCGT